jgi:hypothetical protein
MRPEHQAFLDAFEAGEIPNAGFRHRDHLLMAWLYLRRDGQERGTEHIVAGIRRFAAAKGVPEKYNHTETLFWVRLLTHAIEAHPDVDDFDTLLARAPALLDKRLPLRHWRPETVAGADARARWTDPDSRPLPF